LAIPTRYVISGSVKDGRADHSGNEEIKADMIEVYIMLRSFEGTDHHQGRVFGEERCAKAP